MLAFPSMLLTAAEEAGMKVPVLSETDDYDRGEFPHFAVFCAVQLGRPMNFMDEHWGNALVIATIPDEEIRNVSLNDLLSRGLSWAS